METCLELESRLELVAVARQFVRTSLVEWEMDQLVDDTMLICTELVANAVLHARTAIRMTLASDGLTSVRVEVYDENTRMPSQAACPEDATSGRGLNLVAALATAWGTEHRNDGKVVWAEVGRAGAEDGGDCLDITDADTVDEALQRIDVVGTDADTPAPDAA